MGGNSRSENSIMKAAIDIGTNTALLLVAEIRDRKLHTICEKQRVPRLGEGVDQSGNISAAAIQRVIRTLKEYRGFLNQQYPDIEEIYVTATSAAREAENKIEFVQKIEQDAGFEIQILSGVEEAQYTFWGALGMLDNEDEKRSSENNTAVLDIGGGSTELVCGREGEIEDRYSYGMGCVRFTERFLKDDPPTQKQIDSCKKEISAVLSEHKFNFGGNSSLVGVAGTVTSLAFIDMQLEEYKSGQLTGHKISKRNIDRYINRFKGLSASELLQKYPTVMEGRADIFLAGLLILQQLMEMYGFNQLTVSTGGIRHGVLIGL